MIIDAHNVVYVSVHKSTLSYSSLPQNEKVECSINLSFAAAMSALELCGSFTGSPTFCENHLVLIAFTEVSKHLLDLVLHIVAWKKIFLALKLCIFFLLRGQRHQFAGS